ncbi:RNB domain-containing ribonuclease [Winogradskyella sp.]|uniref:ribonuclease R family protein n=1 Tax=Winogradskyella sp. TaxID=1883156 RepID=UPI00261D6494|nr:RNB domain-containing ribonuclease [Winogradskyella sp.]
MTRKRKKKSKNNKISNLTQTILGILKKERNKSFNYKQIAAILGVNDASSRNQIIKTLAKLAAKQEIEQVDRGKFKALVTTEYHTGILDLSSRGSGYVISDDFEEDVFIASNNINKALDGDEVEFYAYKRRKRGKIEGEITNIIKRAKSEYVGTIQIKENKNYAFVLPDSSKMYKDIFVPINKTKKAEDGDKVLVTLTDWPENADSPYGKVLEVLGKPGEHSTEIHSILAEYGLPHEFPYEVEQFANQLDLSITEKEIAKRRDMRKDLTFTIDPKDAKDFDDALSFKVRDNDLYEIGIHIADVSHYLEPGTVLDDEAYERATSIYLVDRVVPMLPEILSNGACSLRPHEEKYTFSAVFQMNDKCEIKNQWFGRTVTYSDARFAYEEAQAIIEQNPGFVIPAHPDNYREGISSQLNTTIPQKVSLTGQPYNTKPEIAEAVLVLDRLAKKMRTKRMRSGAISFDKVEVKFNLDGDANPTGVFFKTSKDANKLIEEFMLLANRKVSEFIGKQNPKKTFVYRVHDEPDESKLVQLQTVVGRFGHKLTFKDRNSISSSLNKLLTDVVGKKEQNLVDTLTIRTMAKAEYTTHNIGHYGLAFDYYSHFTSPIRRYPDVMAHRLLQHYLDGGKSANEAIYEEKCKHSSNMEYLATKAERDSIKYMQIRFMQDHKDEEFLGVISGVTDWGIYVEIISNKCEGMVSLRDMKDDTYDFDQTHYAMIGRNTNSMYQLGDEVIVKVKATDLVKKHLDFYLVGKPVLEG